MKKVDLEIRIIPMSKKEFKGSKIPNVQKDYFLNDLPKKQDGYFHCYKRAIVTTVNSLLLFQYDKCIIASGIYKGIDNYKDHPIEGKYHKAIIIDKDNIKVFDPITVEELMSIVKGFKPNWQTKVRIDYKYFDEIKKLIEKKQLLWGNGTNNIEEK